MQGMRTGKKLGEDAESEALKALARGDPSGLERIYREHKDRLFTVAFHLLGDEATAEDVLHDVFLHLARHARELRRPESLRAYLMMCCANRARDRLRGPRPAPDAGELLADRPARGPGPEEGLARRDDARRVAAALARLPDEQREVVVLHLHGQLKFRDIAELLSNSVNTAQSRYRYALKALRERLPAEGA